MFCGKKQGQKSDVLAKLRDLSTQKVELKLNQFNMIYDHNNAEWRSI